ncbi:MAG: methyltransferase domain-containing protein [Comamonadaceae bacterium]|nr:methyltransferase domain-containing protein [Comamonadaceae bacterium]
MNKYGHETNPVGINSREFIWTDSDFTKVQSLIYQRAGINLHDGKHAMVYSRLSRRLRETGYKSFKDYLIWLEGNNDGREWQEFINALTTNLTSFFRERHHFEILEDYLRSGHHKGNLQIWCSASSTGEEPYSILMTALDALNHQSKLKLIASDIDSNVLATAAQGIYHVDDLGNVAPEQMKVYFLRGKDSNKGMARVKSEYRNMIQFMTVNLVEDNWSFQGLFDVVFCRNVMIYFDGATQRKVLERIHRVMAPGGLLFVGHAENFTESRDLFVLKGKTVYEHR